MSASMAAGSRSTDEIRYLDTATAYDLWSKVYDTDGNFLQALDSVEMKRLLPKLLSAIPNSKPWRIIDLGCGTGRNTAELLKVDDVEVSALDLSPKMLEIARQRLDNESKQLPRRSKLYTYVFDMLNAETIPDMAHNADAIVSTLVVEHVPLAKFFDTATKMLKPDGLLLVTNMHSEMGGISQAGFVDPQTGQKIRPTSYVHTISDLVQEAARQGFKAIGDIEERSVDRELAPQLGIRAEKWVGVRVWFGGIFCKTAI